MTRVRIVVQAVLEYDADPSFYEEGATAEDMAKADIESLADDPGLLLTWDQDDVTWSFEGSAA